MRKLTFSLILVALAALARVSQGAPAAQTLPDSIGQWTAKATPGPAIPNSLPAELARETGQTFEARTYTLGEKTLDVALEEFRDPSSAYEAYTAQLTIGMHPGDLRVPSAVDNDSRMLILIGNFVVDLRKASDVSTANLQALIAAVQKQADKTPHPPIRSFLPEDGLVQGSQRYALGLVGFQSAVSALERGAYSPLGQEIDFKIGAEAMLGQFWLGRGPRDVLLLVAYPTPQLAEQHLHHIEAALSGRPEFAGTTVERRGSLLSMVLSPSSANVAQVLRDRINYGTQVTWNEPSHTLTDPPWVTVLKNIFLGTFLFCGLALVLGIAFGGFRVLIKRLFPGKVFDRPEQIEVLQLGLSGKPIDPKDLY